MRLAPVLIALCAASSGGAALDPSNDPAVAPPALYAGNDELRRYIDLALRNRADLKAVYFAWRAKLERIPQVKSLDDPMLQYSQVLRNTDIAPEIMLSQMFPWFGTLRARGDVAAAEAEAALYRLYAERNMIVEDVKRTYYEFDALCRGIAVMQQQLELMQYMSDIVASKIALGLASEDELLQLGIQRTQMQDRLDGMVRMRPALEAEINACCLGDPAAFGLPAPQPSTLPPDPPPHDELLARLEARHPELLAIDRQIAAAKHRERVARLKGFPNITLGIEWNGIPDPGEPEADRPRVEPFASADGAMKRLRKSGGMGGAGGGEAMEDIAGVMGLDDPEAGMGSEDGDDEWMVSVGVTLPFWRRRVRAGIEEARLMGEAARYERLRAAQTLNVELSEGYYLLDDAKRRYRLYSESLIPQALQTYESVQNRYAAGVEMGEFLALIEAVSRVLDFQLEQIRAEKEWQIAAAMIERIAGYAWAAPEHVPADAAAPAAAPLSEPLPAAKKE